LRLLTGTGSNPRAATERSVTLLRVFLLASAAVIAAGASLLSSILTHAVSDQAPVVVDAFFFAAPLLPDQLGLHEPLQRAV
jgi:hypothetical protein